MTNSISDSAIIAMFNNGKTMGEVCKISGKSELDIEIILYNNKIVWGIFTDDKEKK